ncbi:hypothetical protein E1B28_002476 [Marasmius oreades]|uniref:Uncharacterized protein n=1 Tax=Marasmius oreades TaxID=181124 RepID=A0A9P7ULS8_9AGAR|nr:uncharacterized protein E1B28_002476 [Marasmius oreades]KAG7086525.1 hypothetical protein E1B28_002476 [Marasmius oreades]
MVLKPRSKSLGIRCVRKLLLPMPSIRCLNRLRDPTLSGKHHPKAYAHGVQHLPYSYYCSPSHHHLVQNRSIQDGGAIGTYDSWAVAGEHRHKFSAFEKGFVPPLNESTWQSTS